MNVSQYKPSNAMREDAVESLSRLALIDGSIDPAGERRLKPGERAAESEERSIEPNVTLPLDGAILECACDGAETCIVSCTSDASSIAVPNFVENQPVTSIAPHAFSACYKLEHVELPDSIASIGGYAFMNTALTAFDSPAALRELGSYALYKCANLERVSLDEKLEQIGEGAFKESALAAVSIPASVSFIGHDAFKSTCLAVSGAPTLRIADNHPSYRLEAGALYLIDGNHLELVQVLDEDIVEFDGPEGLIRISDRAFVGLKRLARVKLPDGVEAIGNAAFKGCSNLTAIELPDSLVSIGRNAFNDTSLEQLRIPAALESAGIAALYTGGSVAERFERTIRSVEIDARNQNFHLDHGMLCWKNGNECVALLYVGNDDRIVIPRNVTAVGPYAFLKATSVRHLSIHDGVEYIGAGGLDFGRALEDIEYLVYNGGDQPVERYLIAYPPGKCGWQASRQTLSRGSFNLAYAYASADNAVLITQDVFNRSKATLERLAEPTMLDERMRESLERKLVRSLAATVVAFGRNGFPQGVDQLLDAGMIDQDNIDGLIEAASDAGEIAVLSRLMEIKRTAFSAPLFDFDL